VNNLSLEELGHIVGKLSVGLVVEPPQLGDAAHELDEGGYDKVLKAGPLICKVTQDVVSYVDPLGDCEVVPVSCDELREGVGSDETGVVRLGLVQDILALRDVVRRGLEAEEAGLSIGAGDRIPTLICRSRPRVQRLAQRLNLRELLGVHDGGRRSGAYLWRLFEARRFGRSNKSLADRSQADLLD